jgi:hypothetical protein
VLIDVEPELLRMLEGQEGAIEPEMLDGGEDGDT